MRKKLCLLVVGLCSLVLLTGCENPFSKESNGGGASGKNEYNGKGKDVLVCSRINSGSTLNVTGYQRYVFEYENNGKDVKYVYYMEISDYVDKTRKLEQEEVDSRISSIEERNCDKDDEDNPFDVCKVSFIEKENKIVSMQGYKSSDVPDRFKISKQEQIDSFIKNNEDNPFGTWSCEANWEKDYNYTPDDHAVYENDPYNNSNPLTCKGIEENRQIIRSYTFDNDGNTIGETTKVTRYNLDITPYRTLTEEQLKESRERSLCDDYGAYPCNSSWDGNDLTITLSELKNYQNNNVNRAMIMKYFNNQRRNAFDFTCTED